MKPLWDFLIWHPLFMYVCKLRASVILKRKLKRYIYSPSSKGMAPSSSSPGAAEESSGSAGESAGSSGCSAIVMSVLDLSMFLSSALDSASAASKSALASARAPSA